MFSIFSFTDSTNLPAQSIDLQLLSDDELLSIWEQTQFAEIMLAERGIPPRNVNNYTKLVETEIQSRAMLDREALMLNAIQNKEPYKNFAETNSDMDFFEL